MFVRITAGTFYDLAGHVRALDTATKTAAVGIVLFGRETPVEVPMIDLVEVDEMSIAGNGTSEVAFDPISILDE